MLKQLVKKLFLVKEIKSKTGDLHFRRWRLLSTPLFNIYIHNIYKADEDIHLHDHPWNYFNLILKGGYYEKTVNNTNLMVPGKYSFRKCTTLHKIEYLISPTISLFITGRSKRTWGYVVNNSWYNNIEYRIIKNNGFFKHL